MSELLDCYDWVIQHGGTYRIGNIAGKTLQTKRGGWVMKVQNLGWETPYWLRLDDELVIAPGGVRIGRIEELVPVESWETPPEAPELDELLEHDAWFVYLADTGGWVEKMIDYGAPVRVFLANLLRFGFVVRVDDAGRLAIRPPADYTPSPVFLEEIRKRQDLLIEILTPPPPDELAPYFNRLIGQAELNAALVIARRHGLKLRHTRSGARYLLEIDSTPAPEVVRRQLEAVAA